MPEHMQVVLGTRETMAFRPTDFLAYYRAVRGRFMRAVCSARGHVSAPGAALPAVRLHVTLRGAARSRRPPEPCRLDAARPGRAVRNRRHHHGRGAGRNSIPTCRPASRRKRRRGWCGRRSCRSRRGPVGHHYELLPPEAKRGFGLLPAPSTATSSSTSKGTRSSSRPRARVSVGRRVSRSGTGTSARSNASIAQEKSERSSSSSTSCTSDSPSTRTCTSITTPRTKRARSSV